MEYYLKQLNDELAKRCEKNPRYSMRAFAKALRMDVAALSRILAGKQIPSYKLTQKLIESLQLDPQEQDKFLSSVSKLKRNKTVLRVHSAFKQKVKVPEVVMDLSVDHYRVIADWYHVAILVFASMDSFDPSPKVMAKTLGISQIEAKLAVERLVRLELLEEKHSRLVPTHVQFSSADKHITTPAHKKNQKQFLEKALDSLENDSMDVRNMSSMTMAIDPKKLPKAKQMIRDFNDEMCEFLESGKKTKIYNMSIALYPLQKNEEK